MKPKALLLLPLVLAIVVYIAVNYTAGHAAQQGGPSTVRVQEIKVPFGGSIENVQITGRIVGFSCVWSPNSVRAECYVAATD